MLNDRNATTTTLIAAGTWLDEKLATSAAAAAAAGVGDGAVSPTIADESLRPFMESLTLAAVLLLLILFCVIGNVFVIVAIACERDLRGRPQYYLIFSLAVADLVVRLYFFHILAYKIRGFRKIFVVMSVVSPRFVLVPTPFAAAICCHSRLLPLSSAEFLSPSADVLICVGSASGRALGLRKCRRRMDEPCETRGLNEELWMIFEQLGQVPVMERAIDKCVSLFRKNSNIRK